MALVFMIAREGRVPARLRRQVGGRGSDRLNTGLLVIGDDRNCIARLLFCGGSLEDRYTNIKLLLREGRKVEVDLPQQGFAVLPISAVLDSANSRLSELLLGTTRGRLSRG